MAELQGGKRKQPSTCPEGWLPAAIVVQLDLTRRQERYAQRCVGIARFVYNRMVANDQAGRDVGLWLTPHELEKEFNAAKHVNPALSFTTEVSKFVAQGACRNYRNARSRWLSKDVKARRPVFHRKHRTGAGSFLAASGVAVIRYDGHRRIRLPYLGTVRMTRALPEGIHYEVTIKKRNGRWWAGIAYWKPPVAPSQRETQLVGGVDVGISPLAVDGGGEHPNPDSHYQPVQTSNSQWQYPNPKSYGSALNTLRRWQRAQARRTPGSRGWWEAQRRIDRAHRRAKGLRDNAHHHISRALAAKYHILGIETLNVAGMIRAGLQSRACPTPECPACWTRSATRPSGTAPTLLRPISGIPAAGSVQVCGVVNTELGREPKWSCPGCDVIHDRNENAARNLQKLALLAVGEDVMLLDGGALAGGGSIAGETAPDEGRTRKVAAGYGQLKLLL